MRILLLTDALPNGGAERQLSLLATHLPSEYEVRVFSMGDGPFTDHLRVNRIPVAVHKRRTRFGMSPLPHLWHALTWWRPDVVHSWGWIATMSAGPMCRALGLPLVDGTIRTATPPSEFISLKRFGMTMAALVVANSRAGLESWRVPAAKGRVVYNGFDASRLEMAQRPRSDSGQLRVVMVGRMEPEKDFATLLTAARALAGEREGWVFTLVGDGTQRRHLEAMSADLVSRGVVEFTGGGIEVLDVVARSDVGVLMTDDRWAKEGFSNALMEYMACGLPAVCGEGGGNRELVNDGVNGFVIPPGDPVALADTLRELRNDPERRAAVGEAGRARILGDFTVGAMVDEYRDVYQTVTRARPGLRATMLAGNRLPPRRDRLRILMLTPYPHVHGPLPTIVPLLAEQLRVLGCDVEMDFWSRHADSEDFSSKLLGRTLDLRRILAHLRRGCFDVLFIPTAHTWAGLLRDVPLVLLSRLTCPHRVVQFHGSYSDRLNRPGRRVFKLLSRCLVRQCDAVIVLSQEACREWAAFEPRTRFEVALNPFSASTGGGQSPSADPEVASRAAPRSRDTTILFVGRIMAEKGVFDLVEAVALLTERGRAVHLVFAGSGPAEAELRRLIEERGLLDVASVCGHIAGDGLRQAYLDADVFALPTYWAEGFPTVLLEAMDAGLPIVTTPIRGAVDELVDEVNVLYVPARRPRLLAAALERLCNDQDLRHKMGRANTEKVADFEPSSVAHRYMTILGDVVNVTALPLTTAGP